MATAARSTLVSRRVKPTSRSTKHLVVRNLKCFPDVHRKLIEEGVPLRTIARYIQDERNEMTHLAESTVVNHLHNYRVSIPAAQRAGPLNVVFERAAEEVVEGLNELEEMQRLYKIQMQRIEIDFQTEKNIKKLLPSMTQEIKAAREILSSSAQLKMDLGLAERHLGKMDVDVETTLLEDVTEKYANSPSVTKVLDNGDSRRRVLGLAERLLSIADRAERHPEVVEQLEEMAPVRRTSDSGKKPYKTKAAKQPEDIPLPTTAISADSRSPVTDAPTPTQVLIPVSSSVPASTTPAAPATPVSARQASASSPENPGKKRRKLLLAENNGTSFSG